MSYVLGGLAIGSVYALIAIGVVLIFRSTGVVNFAQGELMMIGAYAYVEVGGLTTSPIVSMIVAVSGGIAAGSLFFFVVHHLLRGRSLITMVIGTLALLLLLQAAARLYYTDNPRRAEGWIFGDRTVMMMGTNLTANSLLTLGFTILVGLGFYVWFRFSLIGKAMLAVAESPHRAALSGVPVRLVLWMSWAIGGGLAAAAGVLVSPLTGVFPAMGGIVLFPAFIAALLGGLDSVLGAVVGGLLLGLLETYAVVTVGGTYRDMVVFALLIVLLLFRPAGLFGSASLRRF